MVYDRLAGHVLERRAANSLGELARDIATQLRNQFGKAVVVCEEPAILMPIVKKQWLVLARQLLKARASTIDVQCIQGLTREIAWMQTRKFSTRPDPELLEVSEVDVLFAAVSELLRYAPVCRAMYVTCPITKEQLYVITVWMPRGSSVVLYTCPPHHTQR